jgi:transglutaminase-like putative cysteine protease
VKDERRRLVFRDLAAGSAFASMAVSGEIPPWALAIFAGSLALALAGRRVFSGVAVATAVGLLAAAVVLYGESFLGRLDLVVASCTFAGLITAHRMLSAPAAGTDSQIHLTSLLMLAGGAALSGELLFAVALALFAVFGTLSLGLGVFAAAGARAPRAAVRQLAVGAVLAVAGSGAFFVLFPRLSWNVAGHRLGRGLAAPVSGFSDWVDLGRSTGAIKTSSRPVLHATLSPDPGKDELDAYWVGRIFDTFDGRSWSSAPGERRAGSRISLAPNADRGLMQRIELLPSYGARTLVALDRPAFFGGALTHGGVGLTRVELVEVAGQEVRLTAATGATYTAYSLPAGNTPADPGLDLERLRRLPPSLDPRIASLAASIAPDSAPPSRVARALESYLRQNYRYTLDLGDAPADPLASFLFDRRAGHCEYFATALAVLLRSRGIPSRLVGGFYGGRRSGSGYVVRAGDAHVWTEALVDGHFLHLDATPEANRSSQASAWVDWLSRVYEAVDSVWRVQVIDYSFRDQMGLASRLVRPPAHQGDGRLPEHSGRWALVAVALLVVAVLARTVLRTRRERSQATRLRAALDRLTARARMPQEGIEEFERRVRRAAAPIAPTLSAVTRRYLEARFGGAPLSSSERRALVARLSAQL